MVSTLTRVTQGSFDGANHLALAGVRHDLAGNQTQLGAGLTMEYAANGRRVLKQTGLASTTYVYDASGQLAMEVGRTARSCTTCCLTEDGLGSIRRAVDGSGTVKGAVKVQAPDADEVRRAHQSRHLCSDLFSTK
jgi:hypothetical protein